MKKLLILIGLFVVLAIIFLAFTFFGKKEEASPDAKPTPTTTQMKGITLQNSVPVNNAVNVPVSQEVTFTFAEVVNEADVEISVGPDTGHAVLFRGKTVIVRPVPAWNAGTPYRISIQYSDNSKIPEGINFTTAGEKVEKLPDTGPNPSAVKQSEDLQREESPDVFLSNYMPYEESSFSITSAYKASPTGHFSFTVTIKNGQSENQVRGEVKTWILSLGLTEKQYSSLDISFK